MKRLRGRFSMAWIATVATLVPLLAAGGLLLYIGVRTTRRVSDALGEQVMAEATARVESSVRDYLHHTVRISDLFDDLLLTGVLPETDVSRWRIAMLATLRTTPEVASIGFANAADDYVYLMRFPPELEYGTGQGGPEGTTMHPWHGYLDGHLGEPARPSTTFRVRERPWYQVAMQSSGPMWSPAYTWFTSDMRPPNPEYSVAYTRAVRDAKTGRFIGVLSIDTLLTQINTTLRELSQPIDALLVITDGGGGLIGASDLGPGVTTLPPGRRMQDIPNRLSQALAAHFIAKGTKEVRSGRPSHLSVDGQLYWVSQTRLDLGPGTHWFVTIAIPEHSILAPVHSGVRWMIIVGSVFIAIGGIVSVASAWVLARPLQHLAVFARAVGAGHFGARIDIGASSEMVELSEALNGMAQSLQERVNLLAQRDAAEQATAAKSRLIAHVSHEFRTPLNAVINYAELLRDSAASQQCLRDAEDATNIVTASRHLLSLVENLLDLSMIDAGRLRLETCGFSITDLIHEVAANAGPIVERQGNRQHIVLPAPRDARMTSDPTRVRQILINLVANAGKFTRDGDVTISATIDEAARTVHFEVADTGPGIPAEVLPRLFEPFVHVGGADRPGVMPGAGAGIGLTISRQLARNLGGDITVETGPGGTHMHVTLPLDGPPPERAPAIL